MKERLQKNLDEIFNRINDAAARSERDAKDITLVAVTKFHNLDELEALKSCGITIFGESRVQEAKTKVGLIDGITWHLVGHLQTNKAKNAVKMFSFIHSIDSVHLAEELDKRCENEKKIMPICLEINIASEEAKYGIRSDDCLEIIKQVVSLPHLKLEGLMTMAPFVEDAEIIRRSFRGLRELRDRINDSGIATLPHLSMGMTHDYEIAIEEGATILRIGSAIFN
jgi:PLP dependent protein